MGQHGTEAAITAPHPLLLPLAPEVPLRPQPVLSLDDGGVMNDNARRAPQWRRLVGDFLIPRPGGRP